jgi:hypothetical protein
MSFDAQAIFADLAEKERIKGHHSPEGHAIRMLSRALHGLSSGNLSGRDVVVLCDQALEDWLKAKCKVSPWSVRSLPEFLIRAVQARWISRIEAVRLQKLRNVRQSLDYQSADLPDLQVESTLKFCIELLEKHWQ